MPKAAAASGTVIPAKYRSRTTAATAGSCALEAVQRLVEGQQVVRPFGQADLLRLERSAAHFTAVPAAGLASGVVNQDTPHGLGRGGKEVAAVFKMLAAGQAEVGLVDQRGRFERLAGPFLRQFPRGQLAQLVIDQRQKLLRGRRVAGLDLGKDAGDVGHTATTFPSKSEKPEFSGRLSVPFRAARGVPHLQRAVRAAADEPLAVAAEGEGKYSS